MGETAEERARRLALRHGEPSVTWYGNLGGAEWCGGSELFINHTPCVEIVFKASQRCTLVKFTKFNFKF